jgi:putative hydrolase of the HAD superfamily
MKNIKAIIWDLDNTLYRFDKVFEEACNRAAAKTICALVGGLDEEETFRVAEESYAVHGYSGKALIAQYGLDYRDYHFPFHESIDEKILQVNAAMQDALRTIDLPQVIVTNASRGWAHRALDHLGLRPFFPDDMIIPIEDVDFAPKAYSRIPFDLALEKLGVSADVTLMADDMPRNLKIPKEMGMYTALIHHGRVPDESYDYIDMECADTLTLLDRLKA